MPMRKHFFPLLLAAVLLVQLCACAKKEAQFPAGSIVGLWKDAYGLTEYRFKGDGTMEIRALSLGSCSGTYSISGDNIFISYRVFFKDVKNTYRLRIDGDVLYLDENKFTRKKSGSSYSSASGGRANGADSAVSAVSSAAAVQNTEKEEREMTLDAIHIRDPFILTENGSYYLYGTRCDAKAGQTLGFDVYRSSDLKTWKGPETVFSRPADFWATQDFWAPEVHKYQGRFYMFASFKSEKRRRGTQILSADSPLGPFVPYSDGPLTPEDWECLDGTLYVDRSGTPYLVFCHEWVQVQDGEVCAVQLSADLKQTAGKPFVLFRASEAPWGREGVSHVTDGPFLYRTSGGTLLLLWSSFDKSNAYVEAVASSDSGEITGKWTQSEKPLYSGDGGHGMLFRTAAGQLTLVLHSPNSSPLERAGLFELSDTGSAVEIQKQG